MAMEIHFVPSQRIANVSVEVPEGRLPTATHLVTVGQAMANRPVRGICDETVSAPTAHRGT
jgi:hypothetical protein